MGGLCERCIEEDPDAFACKDPNCEDAHKGIHFHPPEDNYFVDINGNKV